MLDLDFESLAKYSPLTLGLLSIIGLVYLVYRLVDYVITKRSKPDEEPKIFTKAWMERVDKRLREYHEINQKITELNLQVGILKNQANRIEVEFKSHLEENGVVRERLASMSSDISNIKDMQRLIWDKINGS